MIEKVQIYIKTNNQEAFHSFCIKSNKIDKQQLINYEKQSQNPFIHQTIKQKQFKFIQDLLELHIYDNLDIILDSEGLTPLAQCSINCYLEGIQLILSQTFAKFDINFCMEDGSTALHVGALFQTDYSENPCLQILLKNGAHLNSTTYQEGTPLHVALQQDQRKNALYFLKQDIQTLDLMIQDNYGNTPVHEIIFLNFSECWKITLKMILNMPEEQRRKLTSVRNYDGNNMLHLAAIITKKSPFILQNILENKDQLFIDPEEKNDFGQSYQELIEFYQKSIVFDSYVDREKEEQENQVVQRKVNVPTPFMEEIQQPISEDKQNQHQEEEIDYLIKKKQNSNIKQKVQTKKSRFFDHKTIFCLLVTATFGFMYTFAFYKYFNLGKQ